MDINEYTVCDKNGNSGSTIKGKYVTAGDNYTFYVKLPDKTAGTAVKIMVPMGGPQSGFFRFPRIGEKVLVCQAQNNGYYLMGFVPSVTDDALFYPEGTNPNKTLADTALALETANETEKAALGQYIREGYNPNQRNPGDITDFLKDNGMALRYKQEENLNLAQGDIKKNAGKGAYSEIAFYNKAAKWPETGGGTDYPRQDTINIQSTGDIESRAENYQLLKANRFEILVGEGASELSSKARVDNATSDDWEKGKAPLGDHVMDKPAVEKGDLHIRAGKRVIIKADNEIRLQVGRTTLVINDKGFNVVSRKVNTNVPTTFDTSLALDSRTGISMFGQTVGIGAGHGFSIAEGLGGAVSSTAGVLSLGGREVKAASASTAAQIFSLILYGIDWAFNTSVASTAVIKSGKSAQEAAFSVVKVGQIAKIVTNFISVCVDAGINYKNVKGAYDVMNSKTGAGLPDESSANDTVGKAALMIGLEPLECLSAVLGLTLNITSIVYAAVDAGYSVNHIDTKEFRDQLNLCSMVIDNAIIEGFAIAVTAIAHAPTSAVLRLRANGDAVIKAAKDKSFYAMEAKKGAATATLVPISAMNSVKILASAAATVPPILAASVQIATGVAAVEKLKTEGL
jgi:hypothetical protein